MPLDEYTAQALSAWYRVTPHCEPEDWVFASNSNRAGRKRGKQPLWLHSIMRYHIQPVVRELGIDKRASWHTLRRTYRTLLQANREDIKVVQELLRHGSGEGDDGCVRAGADASQAEGATEGRGGDAAGGAPAGTCCGD